MLLNQGMANELWEQEIKSMGKRRQLQPKTLISNFIANLFFVLFQFNSLQSFPVPVFLLSYMQKLSSETIKQGCQFYKKQASIRNCIKHWQPTQQQHSIFLNVLLIVDSFLHHFKHQQWSLQLLLQAQYWWMSDYGTVKERQLRKQLRKHKRDRISMWLLKIRSIIQSILQCFLWLIINPKRHCNTSFQVVSQMVVHG